ncbi:DUF808 domain-containing protein [Thalassotalea sp. LPB0316]|uniref:DUF808 domain-containing protein n=1 Tax=Thalassotalea sp. LPB0316 TaxID=2769490 RepID=UPI00186728E7|nr:DUF808 domain-containing protein [Thalassotalea sp. LPB0316]QOL25342.1 DUF808 domain-containing protein [Thalassotalea sp. LPB0316]
MAGTSLLALIDDIATLLDDVAVMSKVAAKKTAGVLGDDLAVNAEQVSGVKADRELPVVWAVAKGSFKNKLILVPAALLISAYLPWLITPLLLLGGCFLCYEGVEKIAHWLSPDKQDSDDHKALINAVSTDSIDLLAFEKQKIKGAIRTDFILSAEIVVIALGTVQEQTMQMQAAVISSLAILITVGVYGVVAGIVKLDDAGLYLVKKSQYGRDNKPMYWLGSSLLAFAPKLMKALTIIGTVAMLLVGGGIFTHGLPFLHHLVASSSDALDTSSFLGGILSAISPLLMTLTVGFIIGAIAYFAVEIFKKLQAKKSFSS